MADRSPKNLATRLRPPVQLAAARSDAARKRRERQRHRNGRGVVTVEIDIQPVTAYLVDAGLLQLGRLEDRQAIGLAIRDLLDLLLNLKSIRLGCMGTVALRAKEYRQRKRHGRACFEIEADEILHWQQHRRVGRGPAPETRRYRHNPCRNLRRNVDLAFDLGLGARF
jgi:hypothetical protein